MAKIKVQNPVVELDGDEMTRIIWQFIKDRLIHPYLDVDLEYYDLGIESRDATDDQITDRRGQRDQEARRRRQVRDHHAGRGAGRGVRPEEDVGVAQRHDPQHPRRRRLPRADHHQQHPAAGAGLDQADRDRPSRARRPVQGDQLQGARRRRADHHLHARRTAREPIQHVVANYGADGGVAMGMYNFNKSIARLRPGVASRTACSATTRSTCRPRTRSSRPTTARSRTSSPRSSRREFKADFEAAGLTYEHRLIDDMVAAAMKWEGGYVWACKNYDGDVQSDTVAQGFGSLGLMTSVLMTPDGKTVEAEAAHGTVTRHYRQHQQGKPTSTNPIASIFAWTGGLKHRGKLDGTPEVTGFAETLEQVCVETVESGKMTKDLALLVGPDQALADHRGVPGRPRRNLAAKLG